MNSSFLTLPSDSSMGMFPNNTQCCFKIHLPKTIHIDKEEWEVALVQLITPTQFLNISEEEAQFELRTYNNRFSVNQNSINNRQKRR